MKLIPMLLLVTGMVLIVAGLKNKHPVDIIVESLGKPGTRGTLDGSKPIVGFSAPVPQQPPTIGGSGGPPSQFLRLPIVEG